jgi:hypothetical protein
MFRKYNKPRCRGRFGKQNADTYTDKWDNFRKYGKIVSRNTYCEIKTSVKWY